jgi:CPA2 family monovalent cation:H+ antiporter-2
MQGQIDPGQQQSLAAPQREVLEGNHPAILPVGAAFSRDCLRFPGFAAESRSNRVRYDRYMHHETTLLTLLAAGLVLAFVLGTLAHRFKLSPLVGYLLAGVLVGPFTPGYEADTGLASQLGEIGVVLLMFGVGLHFSVDDLKAVRRTALPWALLPILAGTGLGALFARWLGWDWLASAVFGLCLSVASTVVLLRALEDNRLLDTTRGKTAIGWLIVEDLVMVLVLVLLPVFGRAHGTSIDAPIDTGRLLEALGLTVVKLAAFTAVIVVVGRRLVPWLLRKVAGTGSRELFTLSILAIALGVAFASSQWFGVSIALGAFFAGMLLNESELSHKAAADSLPMRDAFAVLFFISVGMLFDPTILIRQPLQVAACVVVIMLGKPLAAWAVVRLLGHSERIASTIAASVSQIGEFSFILAGLAVGLRILPGEGRDLVLAGALISIIANPLVFAVTLRRQSRLKAEAAGEADVVPDIPDSGHAILIGYGRVGSQLAELLRSRGMHIVVIEDDADLVAKARTEGFAVVRGNAAGERLGELRPEGATHALLAIPNAFEAGAIISRLRAANPAMTILARAHSDAEVRHLLGSGADGAVLAERELAYSMAEMVHAGRQ